MARYNVNMPLKDLDEARAANLAHAARVELFKQVDVSRPDLVLCQNLLLSS